MKKFFKYITGMVIDFFLPPKCPICSRYIEDRSKIYCPECLENNFSNMLAVDYLQNPIPFLNEVWRITRYREGARDILLDLKFNGNRDQIAITNDLLRAAKEMQSPLNDLFTKVDVAVVVPLHTKRERERGFNQVELIFGEWLNGFGLNIERLILRKKSTKPLFDLNPNERRIEIKDAFQIVDSAKVKGRRILIIDDIYTTGTTMGECARNLHNAGASEIYGLAFASDFKNAKNIDNNRIIS